MRTVSECLQYETLKRAKTDIGYRLQELRSQIEYSDANLNCSF